MVLDPIDVVITWVDPSDTVWQESRLLCLGQPQGSIDATARRYRDMGTLRYLLRGIEMYMPWVNKIFFVTGFHQRPCWLVDDHPRLSVVDHSDFIPTRWLPTFNSHTIELNFHRIPGLGERFVYFNDDMFVLRSRVPRDFFRNGLPCDQASLWRALAFSYGDTAPHVMVNTAAVINQHFSVSDVLREHWRKWLSPRNSLAQLVLTVGLSMVSRNQFPALYSHHHASSFLKSSFSEVWDAEPEILEFVCSHSFRSIEDVSPYVFRFWQMVTGRYSPYNVRAQGRVFGVTSESIGAVVRTIKRREKALLCINDTSDPEIDDLFRQIRDAFSSVFPNPSSFEL